MCICMYYTSYMYIFIHNICIYYIKYILYMYTLYIISNYMYYVYIICILEGNKT